MSDKFKGKILGALGGFWLGGPVGAIIGGVLGHLYDKGTEEKTYTKKDYKKIHRSPHVREFVFISNLVALLTSVAKADRKIDRKEVELIQSFFRSQFNYSLNDRKLINDLIREAARTRLDLYRICSEIKKDFNYSELLMLLRMIYMVAYADNKINDREQKRINDIADLLGIFIKDHEKIKFEFVSPNEEYYRILGIDRNTPPEEIKKAYREMVSKYHPDKVAHLGEEFIEIANRKFREIQEAYEKICKEKGF